VFITSPQRYEHIPLEESYVFPLLSSSHYDLNKDDVTILTIKTSTKLGGDPVLFELFPNYVKLI
jgi:hypothetical protein